MAVLPLVDKPKTAQTKTKTTGNVLPLVSATQSVAKPQENKDEAFLPKAAKFVGNTAQEIVRAPIRGALKYSVGLTYKGVKGLATGVEPQELNVPWIGNIVPAGGQLEDGTRVPFKKVLGEGVESVLDIGTAAAGGAIAKSAVKQGFKAGVKQAAKIAIVDSAVGAGYGAAVGAQEEGATPQSIATSSAIGAGVGLILPKAAGAALKGTGAVGKNVLKLVGTGLEKTASKLEGYAAKELVNPLEKIGVDPTVKGLWTDVSPEVADQTFLQKIAEVNANAIRKIQAVPERIKVGFDMFSPLREVQTNETVQSNMERLGLDVDLAEQRQRVNNKALFIGSQKQQQYIEEVYKPLTQDERYYLKTYLRHLDALDRVAQGNSISGGKTEEQVTKDFFAFRDSMQSLGKMDLLKQQQTIHQRYMNELLDNALESGRISQFQYDNFKKTHPNYIPHFVVDDENNIISETFQGSGGVSANKLEYKAAKGSKKNIEDPAIASLTTIQQEAYKNEVQKANKLFFDSIKGAEGELGVRALKTKEQVDAMKETYKELLNLREERKALENALSKEKNLDRKLALKLNKKIKDFESEDEKLRKDFEQYFSLEAKEVPSLEFPKEIKPSSKLLKLRERSTITEEKLNRELENYFSKQTGDEFLKTLWVKISPKLKRKTLKKIRIEEKKIEVKLGDLSQKLANIKKEILRNEDKLKNDLYKKIFSKEKRLQREALNNLRLQERELEKEMSISANKLKNLRNSISSLTEKRDETSFFIELFESSEKETKNLQKDLRDKLKALRPEKIASYDIPKDMVKVSRLNQGVQEEYLMPTYMGRAIQGLGSEQIEFFQRILRENIIGKILTKPNQLLRQVTTSKNPAFILSNFFRDIQSAFVMAHTDDAMKLASAKAVVGDLVNGFKEALMKNNPEKSSLYQMAGREGLFFDTMFSGDSSEGIYKSLLQKGGVLGKTLDPNNLNPLKAIEAAGAVLEQTTRLAVVRSGLRRGLTPEQAIKEAANATVDFGKKGDFSSLLNQVIPFFNASAQGTIGLFKAMGKNPEEFARRAYYSAAIPATILYSHNREYKSYQNIPDWEKHLYYIVMISESPGRNYKGNKILVPNYIKIPKGIPQQLVTTPIESFFKDVDGQDPETLGQLFRFIGSRTTPVSFDEGLGGGSTESTLKSAVSTPLPYSIKVPVELATNYSFFKGKDIVPDWVYKAEKGKWIKSDELPIEERYSTGSETVIGKELGKAIGLSPMQVDYVLNTGGLKDLFWLLDLGLKSPFEKKAKTKEQGRPETLVEKFSTVPVLRSFLGSSSYGKEQATREKEAIDARETNKRILEKLREKQSGE